VALVVASLRAAPERGVDHGSGSRPRGAGRDRRNAVGARRGDR